MPATTSPEALDGVVGGASSEAADEAEATDGGPAFNLFLFWSRIHLECMLIPRCAPTPALRLLSTLRTRQTKPGYRGSFGQSCAPLKRSMASSSGSWP